MIISHIHLLPSGENNWRSTMSTKWHANDLILTIPSPSQPFIAKEIDTKKQRKPRRGNSEFQTWEKKIEIPVLPPQKNIYENGQNVPSPPKEITFFVAPSRFHAQFRSIFRHPGFKHDAIFHLSAPWISEPLSTASLAGTVHDQRMEKQFWRAKNHMILGRCRLPPHFFHTGSARTTPWNLGIVHRFLGGIDPWECMGSHGKNGGSHGKSLKIE